MIACSSPQEAINEKIGHADFQKMIQSDQIQLIDVRSINEYNAGHLKEAVNLNISDGTLASRLETLDKDKAILVYCAVGGRSNSASQLLSENGFKKIYDLKGGIRAWKESGKEVVN